MTEARIEDVARASDAVTARGRVGAFGLRTNGKKDMTKDLIEAERFSKRGVVNGSSTLAQGLPRGTTVKASAEPL